MESVGVPVGRSISPGAPSLQRPYPCNSEDNKSKAKRSVYRYIDLVLKRGVKNYSIWVGHDAERRMRTGTGENTFRLATLPLDLMHGDAHSWDVIGTITIKTEDGPKRIAISRLWIVLFLDHVSGAVCGYSVGYDEQVAAVTLERGLVSTQTKWLPRKLYPPLKYVKGAALPAGNLPGLDVCNFASLKLDNFSSHYANPIQENGRKSLGFHMHFGAIVAWWTNPRLERLFGILEQHGIHVLPSSMGSGPSDPLRAKDPVQAAIDHAVEFEYIEDLVETLVTEENVRKGSGRSGMSPFEILRNHIETPSVSFLPRFGPPPHATAPRLGWLILRLRIAGSKEGGRNPYVEHQGRTYTHTKMARDWTFVNQYLTVHIRRADFFVEAFGPDGTFWGGLNQVIRGDFLDETLPVIEETDILAMAAALFCSHFEWHTWSEFLDDAHLDEREWARHAKFSTADWISFFLESYEAERVFAVDFVRAYAQRLNGQADQVTYRALRRRFFYQPQCPPGVRILAVDRSSDNESALEPDFAVLNIWKVHQAQRSRRASSKTS